MFRLNEHIMILVIQWSSECLISLISRQIQVDPGTVDFPFQMVNRCFTTGVLVVLMGRALGRQRAVQWVGGSSWELRLINHPRPWASDTIINLSWAIINLSHIYIYTPDIINLSKAYHRPIIDHQKSFHLNMPQLWSWQSGTRGRLAPLPLR